MKPTEQQITAAMDVAYKEAGHNAYYGNGFKDGAQWAISLQPEWVEVTPETKPGPWKYYFALFKAVNGKYIKCVATYTEGWDLEVDGNDDGDHFNLDEVNERAFMKKGWYECCEQQGGDYDEMYFKRDVVFYLPNIELPHPPTK